MTFYTILGFYIDNVCISWITCFTIELVSVELLKRRPTASQSYFMDQKPSARSIACLDKLVNQAASKIFILMKAP